MQEHLIKQHDRKPNYSCEVCQRGFFVKANLKSHMWVHLTDEEKKEKCSTIRKKRDPRVDGDSTRKSQAEKRTCPVCQQIFATPSRMATHLNTKHEKKKKFACEICSRGFHRSDILHQHLKTHLSAQEKEKLIMLSRRCLTIHNLHISGT
jgi:uncharacterized Zn-finger protein